MRLTICLLCGVLLLFLLCFADVCPYGKKNPNHMHDSHNEIHQKMHDTKKFCDPSFSNQTAGADPQKCGAGLYREWTGPRRGQCVPCSCDELSDECDEQTGNCVNCRFNTTGDRCERCKEGYYGNAAKRTCRACPCPFTWNNFAVACLDVGSGEVECLCRRGYGGARCERCAHGYYGNTMATAGSCKPCNCTDNTLNVCNSLTGECTTSSNSSCGDHCNECDGCTKALLAGVQKLDDGLALLEQQLQHIGHGVGSPSRLNNLNADSSETKIQVGLYSSAVRHLEPNIEQLEADVRVARHDVNRLTDETLQTVSNLEKVLHSATGAKSTADDLLSEAESLVIATQDLTKQLPRMKPEKSVTLAENAKVRMVEEAWNIVQEMRGLGCSAQRDSAGSEQETAHKLFGLIRSNLTTSEETGQDVLNQAEHLMVLDSSLNKLFELLSDAEEAVDGAKGLNLKSTTLQHLQHLQSQLEKEQSTLLPVIEITKNSLQSITNILSVLQEIKKEYENHAAQLDGATWELFKMLNKLSQIMVKVADVSKADAHADELSRAAAEFQHVPGIGAYNGFVNKAKMAANESRLAADQSLKEVEEENLIARAAELKHNSYQSNAEASERQRNLEMLSREVKGHKKHVNKQKKEGRSLRMGLSAVRADLKRVRRDDIKILIEAVKTAVSTSNATVHSITERLKNISQEVERVPSISASVKNDGLLNDAERTLKALNTALTVLKHNLTQVEALSRMAPPSVNLTESIWKIKDVIEETRSFVDRLPVATSFNGRNHVELRPPRNLDDIKAFTAVDLLLNHHQTKPPKTDRRRKRRQNKHAGMFVFYLGNKDTSRDYTGMAIRNNALICVYKLGGVVHEVESGQIITTSVNSSDFDRVVFHRVYQDAEVNVTQKFTSQKPVSLSPSRNLPDTMAGVLDLHPDNVVFYVGGYPEDFTPPVELRYPKYRGAMKLSYINDHPVCLFNYKHAVNMEEKQPYIKTPQSEVSDYYDGTGYRMAFIREPNETKRRLFRFHTKSKETNALLFYIGNDESFFSVFVEKGFLVLRGQQAGQEHRAQSADTVSLFDQPFAIRITNKFVVLYGSRQIFTDHIQTRYASYFVGGLPAELRQRHNVTAPPLRGCVEHVTADGERVEYSRTVGVADGCPGLLLGVRTAMLRSGPSAEPLFVWVEKPLKLCLSFRTTDGHGAVLRSSSRDSTAVHDLQLSLADGHVVLNGNSDTLKSDKRYNDGSWHYLCAARRPKGLELSIDNVNVDQGQSPQATGVGENPQGDNFTACIANLYSSRPEQSFVPADLGSLSQIGAAVLGRCNLHHLQQAKLLPAPALKPPRKHEPAPASGQCRGGRAGRDEHQLYESHSWLGFTLLQQDLNYRPHFSFDLKTKSSKGLIFHVAGRGVIPLLALYVANGKIKMSLGQSRIIQHDQRSDDDHWHRVEFSVENSTFHLLVDGFRVTDGQLTKNEGSSLDLHNPVYLGGDLHSKALKGHNVPMNSVIGCIRNFKMNDVSVGEPETSHNTLPCVEWRAGMGTYFGGGHLVLDSYFPVGFDFTLSFELRPQHLTGLLLHVRSNKTSLDVFLRENAVGVKVSDGNGAVSVTVMPRQSLCDENFHVVKVSKRSKVIKLEVDSLSDQKAGPSTSTSYSTAQHSLHIGGTTKYSRVPVSSPFVGCLRSMKINDRPVAFETESRVVEPVSVNRCPVY